MINQLLNKLKYSIKTRKPVSLNVLEAQALLDAFNTVKDVTNYVKNLDDNEHSCGDYEIHYECKKELLNKLGGNYE